MKKIKVLDLDESAVNKWLDENDDIFLRDGNGTKIMDIAISGQCFVALYETNEEMIKRDKCNRCRYGGGVKFRGEYGKNNP